MINRQINWFTISAEYASCIANVCTVQFVSNKQSNHCGRPGLLALGCVQLGILAVYDVESSFNALLYGLVQIIRILNSCENILKLIL